MIPVDNGPSYSINGATAYPDELAKPVKDGDTIQLVYFLAGG